MCKYSAALDILSSLATARKYRKTRISIDMFPFIIFVSKNNMPKLYACQAYKSILYRYLILL
ncbi:hypothetical protein F230042K4_10830 [Mediterraneibacter glycyrrhizinilyticus]